MWTRTDPVLFYIGALLVFSVALLIDDILVIFSGVSAGTMGDDDSGPRTMLQYVLQSLASRPPAERLAPAPKAIVDAADGTGLSLADLAAGAANVAREWRRGGIKEQSQ